jgi:protease I
VIGPLPRLLALAALLLAAPGKAADAAPPGKAAAPKPKKVVMFIAEGFWAPEYYEPRAIFDKAGFEVTVAGKYGDPVKPDRLNRDEYRPVNPDISFDQVDVSSYDAVVFAGGNGAWADFFPNDQIHNLLATAFAEKKIVALLCSSTGLLGVAHNVDGRGDPLAEGRHVTGYYRVRGLLSLGRVNYDPGEEGKPFVVVDGNLITGRDPSSAELFGQTVLRELTR